MPSKRLVTYSRPSGPIAIEVAFTIPEANGSRRAAGIHAKDRDRRLLSAGAADRDVQAAAIVEHGAVHLVDAGRERPRDVEPHRVAGNRRQPHGHVAAFRALGHAERHARVRCGEHHVRVLVADRDDRRIAAAVEQAGAADAHDPARAGEWRIDGEQVRAGTGRHQGW